MKCIGMRSTLSPKGERGEVSGAERAGISGAERGGI
jgi:hypothetical protein